LGSLIAAGVLKYGWGWSFVVPGIILALGGLLVWFFLVVEPSDVGLPTPSEMDAAAEGEDSIINPNLTDLEFFG
jgi:OPA family glycerol-3-phosphate transporter-like MFS transporter 1/2